MTFIQTRTVEFTEILYSKSDWVARITINRPHAYNAYSTRALLELPPPFAKPLSTTRWRSSSIPAPVIARSAPAAT